MRVTMRHCIAWSYLQVWFWLTEANVEETSPFFVERLLNFGEAVYDGPHESNDDNDINFTESLD